MNNLEGFKYLTKLEELDINVDDPGISYCKKLKNLTIKNSGIISPLLKNLKNCSALENIDFVMSDNLNEDLAINFNKLNFYGITKLKRINLNFKQSRYSEENRKITLLM